jgi:uncharacterized glyoxalase superfamily protein PhnB
MSQFTSPARTVRPIPEGYHTVTPTLIVRRATEAIEFYTRAFGARELGRMPTPDGQLIWHAELQIGDARVMLADEFPDMGGRAPESLGGTPVSLHLYVEDADALVKRAVEAGATVIEPVMDVFWGDRYGRIRDPFGHEWSVGTHVEDVDEEEMRRRASALAGSPT